MQPSVVMCSVRSWPSPSKNISTIFPTRWASRRNGRNCCAISIGCNRCASSIAAPIGWCAPTRRRQPLPCSARPMSRCRRERDKPPRRSLRPPRNPPENAEADPNVVPRRFEFRRKRIEIRSLSKSGVQVGFGIGWIIGAGANAYFKRRLTGPEMAPFAVFFGRLRCFG